MIINNFNLGNYRFCKKCNCNWKLHVNSKSINNQPSVRKVFFILFQKIIFTFGRFLPAV